MKKFILGILFTITFLAIVNTLNLYYLDTRNNELESLTSKVSSTLNSTPISQVLTGRCTLSYVYENKRREWFGCNKIEIYISDLMFGEFQNP